jgi:hypothetical protein
MGGHDGLNLHMPNKQQLIKAKHILEKIPVRYAAF